MRDLEGGYQTNRLGIIAASAWPIRNMHYKTNQLIKFTADSTNPNDKKTYKKSSYFFCERLNE